MHSSLKASIDSMDLSDNSFGKVGRLQKAAFKPLLSRVCHNDSKICLSILRALGHSVVPLYIQVITNPAMYGERGSGPHPLNVATSELARMRRRAIPTLMKAALVKHSSSAFDDMGLDSRTIPICTLLELNHKPVVPLAINLIVSRTIPPEISEHTTRAQRELVSCVIALVSHFGEAEAKSLIEALRDLPERYELIANSMKESVVSFACEKRLRAEEVRTGRYFTDEARIAFHQAVLAAKDFGKPVGPTACGNIGFSFARLPEEFAPFVKALIAELSATSNFNAVANAARMLAAFGAMAGNARASLQKAEARAESSGADAKDLRIIKEAAAEVAAAVIRERKRDEETWRRPNA